MKYATGSLNLSLIALVLFFCYSCKRDTTLQTASAGVPALPAARPAPTTPTVAITDCNYVFNETALANAGWTKTFDDNFENLNNWNIWTGGAFNNELQYYQADNLQITNGELAIIPRKETKTGATTPYDPTPKTFAYTSGRIECKQPVSANDNTPKVRMAARIKLPTGYGMWAAYWSYGDPWPTQGEIDFIEARGQEPTKYQTNYFYGKTAGRNVVRNAVGYITADKDLTTCYHVYEMVWEKDKLTSYLDGRVVEVKTSGGYIPSLFGKTERITLNVAVGGNFFSNFNPAQIVTDTMHVDWVKVFTSK